MDVQAHADGLRELADWIESNGDVLEGLDFHSGPVLLFCRIDPDKFIATAQALDPERCEIGIKSGYLNATRTFGPIGVQVYIDANKVGESTTQMQPTTEWSLNPEIREALGTKAAI